MQLNSPISARSVSRTIFNPASGGFIQVRRNNSYADLELG